MNDVYGKWKVGCIDEKSCLIEMIRQSRLEVGVGVDGDTTLGPHTTEQRAAGW